MIITIIFGFLLATSTARLECAGTLDVTFERQQLSTEFPISLGSAKTLGFYDSSFTAMARVYRDPSASNSGDQAIFGTTYYATNKGLHFIVRDGKYYMGFYYNDCRMAYPSKKGVWEHVAFVYDRTTQTQSIVVDGIVRKQCGGRAPFVGTSTVYLGTWANYRNWRGRIKNVKIFNKALSADEIIRCGAVATSTTNAIAFTTSTSFPTTTTTNIRTALSKTSSTSFHLTSYTDETTNHGKLCVQEFGPSTTVADWERDLKHMSAGEINALVQSLGITPTFNEKYYFVTRGAEKTYSGERVYFFERHDGPAPSNWLVHDQHGGLSLGSWFGIRGQVVCKVKPSNAATTTPAADYHHQEYLSIDGFDMVFTLTCAGAILVSLLLVGAVGCLCYISRRRAEIKCNANNTGSVVSGELVKAKVVHGTPVGQRVDVVAVSSDTITGPFVKSQTDEDIEYHI